MARGTPTGFKTTISGTNVVQDLYTELRTRIEAYQSGGTDAWDMIDEVSASAGSRNHVYQSKGDRSLVSGAGDANLIMELTETSANIYWRPHQDWSDDSSTGSREAGSTSAFGGSWTNIPADKELILWGVVNDYGMSFAKVQGGDTSVLHCGSPFRTHIPPAARGVAFTTAQATSGSSVVLSVDRDLTGILQVGQLIWTQQVTPTATALRSATIEVPTVEAVTTNSVTIDTLSATLESGAIIGLDPTPFGVCSHTNAVPGSLYMVNELDGAYASITGQAYAIENLWTLMTEGDHDPSSFTDLYYGVVPYLEANAYGMRGSLELYSLWAKGTQANGDRMIVNDDPSQAWVIFPQMATAYVPAIGPGMPT